jgi:hypothetical protein
VTDVEELAELLREGRDHATAEEALAELILKSDWLKKNRSETWLEGWYHATNGKWGLPEKGENPYGDTEES